VTQVPSSGRADPLAVGARGIRRTYAAKPWPVEALRGVDLDSILGSVAIGAIGVAMGGLCLQLRQEAWSYPDAVAGALYAVVVAAALVTTVAWTAAGLGTFSHFLRRARDGGLIDRLTSS